MTNKLIDKTLHKTLVIKGTDRAAALDQMLSVALQSKNVGNPQQITRIIRDNEEGFSSAIGSGIAVPHVRHADIKDITVVFGLSKLGMGWMSPDYSPVNFVLMICAPDNVPDYYLEILGVYLSKLRVERFRNKLIKCTSAKALKEMWCGTATAT
jgi:PTS system nitrogen regulatory IIA component